MQLLVKCHVALPHCAEGDSFFFRTDISSDTTIATLAAELAKHPKVQLPPECVQWEYDGLELAGHETAAELDLFNNQRDLKPVFYELEEH